MPGYIAAGLGFGPSPSGAALVRSCVCVCAVGGGRCGALFSAPFAAMPARCRRRRCVRGGVIAAARGALRGPLFGPEGGGGEAAAGHTTSTTSSTTHGRTASAISSTKKRRRRRRRRRRRAPPGARARGGEGSSSRAGVGRGAGRARGEKVDGMGWELSGGGWRWFAVFWGGEPVAEGQLVPLVRMGSGGESERGGGGRGGAGQVHKRGRRRTRRGVRLCVRTCGKGATSATCVYADPPHSLALSLSRSLSLWRACDIAAKLVASFDLRRVRTSPHGRGAEGRRDSGAG